MDSGNRMRQLYNMRYALREEIVSFHLPNLLSANQRCFLCPYSYLGL
jgi:hypothetical protein